MGLVAVGTLAAGGGGGSVLARQAAFALQPNDHISIIGNTLAERMQYDGWLETMIQARYPKHGLVVRNLGFSGDEISTRPRSKNFGTPDEWLSGLAQPIGGYEDNRFAGTNTKADVVFAFFGYNESYAGEAGLDAFRKELTGWIAHTLAQKYNGRSAPRVVLFSPIAHEDLGNPDLPDGKQNNERLALYTKAMADVARTANITFVDLFTPTIKLYADIKAPLTIQGVHLNTEGNRQVAQVIDRALFGDSPKHQEALLTKLRQAVVDKDKHWFLRYRVTDGYSTYGDRAFLTFVRGNPRNVDAKQMASVAKEDVLPSNYDVLQRELPILDQMIANRDKRIWAIAGGSDLAVDDSNTLPFVDAKTNLPKASPFKIGDENIQAMTIGQGLKVELFASEKEFPELVNPVQMAFDTRGRLWVASWKNYPHWQPKTPMDDKLAHPRGHQRRRQGRQEHGVRRRPQQPHRLRVLERRRARSRSSRTSSSSRTPTATTSTTRRTSCCTGSTPPTRTTPSTASRSTAAARSTCRKASSIARGRIAVGPGHAPERRRRLPLRAADVEVRNLRALQLPQSPRPRLRPVGPRHRLRRDRRPAVLRAVVLDQEVLPGDGDQAGAQARRRAHAAHRRRRAPLEPPLPRGDAGQPHRPQHDRLPRPAQLQDQRGRRRAEDRPRSSRSSVRPTRTSARWTPRSAPTARSTSSTGTTRSSGTCSTTCATPRATACTAASTASRPWAGPC